MADPPFANTGFDPAFGGPLFKFLAAAKAQGIDANIISGVRTDQDQRELQANAVATHNGTPLPYPARGPVPVAAPPGSSAHEFGLAADVEASNPADQAKLIALGQKMGLAHPMSYDPTHFEAPDWRTVAANQPPSTPWNGQNAPSEFAQNISAGGPPGTSLTSTPARPVSPTPIPGGSSHADFIRSYAQQIGLNPNLALGIANAEGLRAWSASNPNAASTIDVENGKPFSFGDFQLNIHPGAVGAQAQAAGVDPTNPAQWQQADQFALNYMKQHGVGAWSGDPVAKAYLNSGATPNTASLMMAASNAPVSTTPGTASAGASGSNASTAATAAAGALGTPAGPALPGMNQQQSTQFLQGASGLDKALGGQGLGGQSGDGQSGGGDMKPSPIIQGAPPHIPNPAQAAQTFGQTLNSMRMPPQWGPNPVGAPIYATAGQQGPEINPEAQQMLQQLQMQQQMQMMGGGMGTSLNSYGGFGYG